MHDNQRRTGDHCRHERAMQPKKAADDLGPNASWTQFNVTDTDETERWVGDLLQQT